ncbi:MerR family transcriptional regulator [Microbispora hainanensis]|jgi:DNA-binding transcriptional MerR regulator|uniref:MerR family transcriptional regulator n=1 Tax=Microbispora hainanensis TaxID=568844 RepID=UPI001158C12C|nr:MULTISPECIES: MerR family transcriptional regulator [Microbispora]NJP29401.1 MerR family transcriptional regulator [Microbispora sp. CL1-1]TQS05385.1 MerR family transcriptional regulator [Microbispora sp. SCL1-1]
MLGHVNDDLLSIGRFARLARLSVKQLRHYAAMGLLEPAWIDPASGYRYYHAAQARDALVIGLLRSLDVPLPVIAEVLSGNDGGPDVSGSAAAALARVRDDQEAELARRRRTLESLERILATGLPGAEVTLVTEPPRPAVVVRDLVATPGDIGRATSACVARLLAAAPPAPAFVGLFPLDYGELIPVAVALTGTGLPQVPGAAPETLPGGTFAVAAHVGPYDQIPLTAHALLAWCAERGHAPTGPLREAYVSDPATTPPERLVTHLMIGLEDDR